MDIGTQIREEAESQGYTVKGFAAALGRNRQVISAKLNGGAPITNLDMEDFSRVLRVPVSELFHRAEQAEAGAVADPAAPADTAALAGSATHLSADEVEGPSEAELEAHVEACDSCTCAEDALEHARQSAEEVA
ncbi:MAG: transcriptional regulator [Actinomyces urogenitalis]|uniref:helix-turn-helix domain-containing protein n=1 Tax=Actinomyces urogenitalis TaxID=103621 RepID=UPI0006611420|nr:transcriptional regulator [Actinomyces urogenitalis]MBS6071728.1 transcriptional regulator [Actinomyces urogenitalis]MDU0864603.1 transcriptional regulator [Actinomyces urogenitalis]MDU0875149.1 transcriptional regulator [Actinomyces urogenitalis]MDU1564604.1 transcriptional regulator [Actinomyces urogenitalis]MDU1640169.1 transcriptional regulator [Actinomyces urogenitalis]